MSSYKHEPRSRDAILLIGIFVYGLTFLDFCGNVSSHNIYKIIDFERPAQNVHDNHKAIL